MSPLPLLSVEPILVTMVDVMIPTASSGIFFVMAVDSLVVVVEGDVSVRVWHLLVRSMLLRVPGTVQLNFAVEEGITV